MAWKDGQDSLGGVAVAFIFAFARFISATLLFLVQPLITRMLLPHLGGPPAV